MKYKNILAHTRGHLAVGMAAVIAMAIAAEAQDNAHPPGSSLPSRWLRNPDQTIVRVTADYSYDAPATAKFQGNSLANSDESGLILGVDSRLNVNDEWFVPLGFQSDNFFLGSVDGAPVPDSIHTLHFRTGLGWHWNDQWTFTGLIGPALYRMEDIHSDDIGFSGGVMAIFQQRPNLSWTFGILATPDSDLVVLPLVGVHWKINDQYTLDVGVPKTRLTCRLDSRWALYTGLDLTGTTFRGPESLGEKAGFSAYNNARATYRDIRLGVGAGYELTRGLHAEIEAGCSVYREINYNDLNQQVTFDPTPYVRVGLGYRF